MERLKFEVERLARADFNDIEALSGLLDARFGPIQHRGEMTVQASSAGSIAGSALRDIQLRRAKVDQLHANLLLEFQVPGPAVVEAPWTDALLNPPRPDAPDSVAYWSFQTGGAAVVLGLARDNVHVVYISIKKD